MGEERSGLSGIGGGEHGGWLGGLFVGGKARITDDRGREFDLRLEEAMAEWPSQGDRRIDLLVHRLSVVAWAENTRGGRLLSPPVMAGLGVGVVILLLQSTAGVRGPGLWICAAALTGVLALAQTRLRSWYQRRTADESVRLLLEEGLCADCGYNLAGLGAAADGCVECPECGAAWRGERIVRAEAFALGATFGGDAATPMIYAVHGGATRLSVEDGAGRKVYLMTPGDLRSGRFARDGVHRAAVGRVWRRAKRSGRVVRTIVALVCIGMGAVLGWSMISLPLVGGWGKLVAPLSFVAIGVWAYFGSFGYKAAEVVQAALAESVCPSCGEMVGGVAREDGCVVCGGCKAAWAAPLAHGPGA